MGTVLNPENSGYRSSKRPMQSKLLLFGLKVIEITFLLSMLLICVWFFYMMEQNTVTWLTRISQMTQMLNWLESLFGDSNIRFYLS